MDSEGFVDIPKKSESAMRGACVIGGAYSSGGKHDSKQKKVSITLRMNELDEDVQTVLRGETFSVAYNSAKHLFRIRPSGSYKLLTPGAKAKENQAFILRCDIPEGMTWIQSRIATTIRAYGGCVYIDLPKMFWMVPVAPAARRDVTAGNLGDPPPGRSALDQRRI